ncbi:MAG: hypothetical protein Tsb0032_16120 [Kiloniellaceae bacterium]
MSTSDSLIPESEGGGPATPATPGNLAEGIAQEERSGLAYMFWGRLAVLGLLAAWLLLTLPFERAGLYLAAIAAFALLGAAPYLLLRRGLAGTAVTALFLLADAALLSYLLIVPTPYDIEGWSPQLNLRLPGFLYLGVFLVSMALSYKPALVVWAGIAAILAWSAGYLWVVSLPDSLVFTAGDMLEGGLGIAAVVERILDPKAVALTRLSNQVVFLGLVTVILTLTVWRSRRLVRRQVAAESQRSALSRYFSPNIVRALSRGGGELDRPAVRPVAVLFADMVGFTEVSERLAPEELVGLLRDFHGRLAGVAFAHDGTVDKYIGDAIMVHFGTPVAQDDDPQRALACAAGMVAEIGRWNAARRRAGETPVNLGVGVHYGEAIIGNIGDARRLEYTVLGDTVNVASRLEQLTRRTGAALIVSDDLVAAVRRQGADPLALVPGLRREGAFTVRGRREPITVWRAGELGGAAASG